MPYKKFHHGERYDALINLYYKYNDAKLDGIIKYLRKIADSCQGGLIGAVIQCPLDIFENLFMPKGKKEDFWDPERKVYKVKLKLAKSPLSSPYTWVDVVVNASEDFKKISVYPFQSNKVPGRIVFILHPNRGPLDTAQIIPINGIMRSKDNRFGKDLYRGLAN